MLPMVLGSPQARPHDRLRPGLSPGRQIFERANFLETNVGKLGPNFKKRFPKTHPLLGKQFNARKDNAKKGKSRQHEETDERAAAPAAETTRKNETGKKDQG